MINFVNAKINIGLNIIGRREDGYHLLETCFYPVGIRNGTPACPYAFCDILELTESNSVEVYPDAIKDDGSPVSFFRNGFHYSFRGNRIDCDPGDNLVVRSAETFDDYLLATRGSRLTDLCKGLEIDMIKMLPDGAGLGGGSADAGFMLRMLNERAADAGIPVLNEDELILLASRLGADCPFFIINRPAFAEGIGEKLSAVESATIAALSGSGMGILIVKPDIHISTRQAFQGIRLRRREIPLSEALRLPIRDWRATVFNDFEDTLFPIHPVLPQLKKLLYDSGALYASMSGSGAALYGIFPDMEVASKARVRVDAPYSALICI